MSSTAAITPLRGFWIIKSAETDERQFAMFTADRTDIKRQLSYSLLLFFSGSANALARTPAC